MHPVFFTVFGRPIYGYGVLAALGFAAAAAHLSRLGRRRGRPPGYGTDLAVWLMVGGILGARVAYVAANMRDYLVAPWDILRIDQGGLVFYGGLLGGIAACVVFARVRRLPVWTTGDEAVTAVPLAHAFGRIGCFVNGCCYGRETVCAVSVHLEGVARHPVQLYEAAWNLAVFAVLAVVARRPRRPRTLLALYLLLYPAGRGALEFLRGDLRRMAGLGLNLAQWTSLGLLLAGVVLWLSRGERASCPNAS